MLSHRELYRQLFHIAFGLALVALLQHGILNAYLLLVLLAIGLAVSYAAKHHRILFVHWFLDRCERTEDMKTFPGRSVILYVLGCLIALLVFEKDVAFAGMMVLVLGDSVSHLIGGYYGKHQHPLNRKKLLEGWLAGIAAGFLGALVFVRWQEALAASFVAMTLETVEWGVDRRILDDNLFLPLIAGVVMMLVRLFV